MDTDDLSDMAFETVRIAESIHHMITVHLGVMAGKYRDEDSFLRAALRFVCTLIKKPRNFIDEWGIEYEIQPWQLAKGLRQIEDHIVATLAVPLPLRGLSFSTGFMSPANEDAGKYAHTRRISVKNAKLDWAGDDFEPECFDPDDVCFDNPQGRLKFMLEN
ncbi:MAG TPA: hypothetical protein VLH56_04455 [Dissulfurispiraceae bacterium]|nr:hypothetical protein [Dissulfurispiraceae bacterium]